MEKKKKNTNTDRLLALGAYFESQIVMIKHEFISLTSFMLLFWAEITMLEETAAREGS